MDTATGWNLLKRKIALHTEIDIASGTIFWSEFASFYH